MKGKSGVVVSKKKERAQKERGGENSEATRMRTKTKAEDLGRSR